MGNVPQCPIAGDANAGELLSKGGLCPFPIWNISVNQSINHTAGDVQQNLRI